MPDSQAESPVPADIIMVILKVLQRAGEPLTIKEIQKELPGPFRIDSERLAAVINEQVRVGAVHQWVPKRSKMRFWNQDLEECARGKIMEILSDQALNIRELRDALRKSLFGCSKARAEELRKKILPSLIEEGQVLKHPLMPRKRAFRFGVNPPDPAPYLGKVKKEFYAVCDKLKKAGISPEHVFRSAGKVLLPRALTQDIGDKERKSILESGQHQDAHKLILDKIIDIEPAARQQALVSIRALRAAMDLPAEVFDRAILDLADQGKIWLHRHAYPAQAKKAEVVTDNHGNYYMGVVLRS